MKPNILCIVGPTAVGKTDLFFKLEADGFPFEAISADSRQVYRFMDIGTGKDIPTNYPSKIWLIDIVNPDESFSSAQFCRLANSAIQQILTSNKLPLVIGGTGRYIKDLESSPHTLTVPPNKLLRQTLSMLSIEELQSRLKKLNPKRFSQMNNSDSHNPRRLVRAIEVNTNNPTLVKTSGHQLNIIGLTAPLQFIESRIKLRIDKRISQGMVEEVRSLQITYPDFSSYQSFNTPGYQEIARFLDHQISFDQAVVLWTQREFNYAKRQLTWFKHQTNSVWFDISKPNWYAEIVKQLKGWNYVSNQS